MGVKRTERGGEERQKRRKGGGRGCSARWPQEVNRMGRGGGRNMAGVPLEYF